MNTWLKKVVRGSATLLLACTLAAPAGVSALELYDTFKGVRLTDANGKRFPGKRLDRQLWDSWNTHAALEARREVSGGKAVLKSVTYGDRFTNDGSTSGRSALPFPESAGALITEIQATVQTASMEVTGCEANTGVGEESGRVLTPRIGGFWFSDGTSSSTDDFTGYTWASIDVVRYASHDTSANADDLLPRKFLTVEGKVVLCTNAACTTGDVETKTLGVIKRGQKRRLRIQWDETGNRFVFQLHKNAPDEIAYDGDRNAGSPAAYFKRISHRGQPRNCQLGDPGPTERTRALGEVRILDVKVNEGVVSP